MRNLRKQYSRSVDRLEILIQRTVDRQKEKDKHRQSDTQKDNKDIQNEYRKEKIKDRQKTNIHTRRQDSRRTSDPNETVVNLYCYRNPQTKPSAPKDKIIIMANSVI